MKKMKRSKALMAAAIGVMMMLGGCQSNQAGADLQTETETETEGAAEAVTQEETTAPEIKEVTLYLTRHGKTILNTTGRMQGWSDAPLTENGAEVARKLGKGLKEAGIQFDQVYSSDSGRAVETAELVLQNNGQEQLPIHKTEKLREVCYGKFEGATPVEAYSGAAKLLGMADVNEMMGAMMGGKLSIMEAIDALAESDDTGMAENWATAETRLMDEIQEIAVKSMKQGDDQVLIVFHGMAISAVLGKIDPASPVGELGNASITKIVYDGNGFRVESVNDMSYVGEPSK